MKPRLLDLFCGAGGAAMGYHRAGFDVVGVDINPQPNYPFDFRQDDALRFLREDLLDGKRFMPDRGSPEFWSLEDLDAIHASPPCQAFTAYRRTGNVGDHPDLIAPTRELLQATGLPYVIENVEGAPLQPTALEHDPILRGGRVQPVVKFCGTQFDPPMEIQRHRIFEANWLLYEPDWPCRHLLNGKDRYPGGRSVARTGKSTGLVRGTIEIGSWDIPLAKQNEAMGIDWMTLEELSEAIPPAYTEFIGHQLLAHINHEAAVGGTH